MAFITYNIIIKSRFARTIQCVNFLLSYKKNIVEIKHKINYKHTMINDSMKTNINYNYMNSHNN